MKTLGLWEYVLIRRIKKGKPWKRFSAKLDTGASTSRIGKKTAEELGLGPAIDRRTIRTGNGKVIRNVVRGKVRLAGHQATTEFTVSPSRPGVNIGRNTMGARFKVSPFQRYLTEPWESN